MNDQGSEDSDLSSLSPIRDDMSVADFNCGRLPLDDWLRSQALKSEGKSARTYVVCRGSQIVAYYCLATGSENRRNMPGKIRHGLPDPTPLMILGRLVVDISVAGRGVGRALLKDALARTTAASRIAGVRALMVHAIDTEASAFYKRFGFIEFPANSWTMFLPIETILAAAGG